MKILTIIFTVLLLSGCSGLSGGKKYITDNSLVSENYPKAEIVVTNRLEPYDVRSSTGKTDEPIFPTPGGGSSFTTKSFLFISADNRHDPEIIAIDFMRLKERGWYWEKTPEIVGTEVIYGTVETEIGEMDVYSGIFNLGAMDVYQELRPVFEKASPCAAATAFRQIPNGMNHYKYRIFYFKSFPCSVEDVYLHPNGDLTDSGKKFLLRSQEAAKNAFKIFSL